MNEFEYIKKYIKLALIETFKFQNVMYEYDQKKDEKGCTLYFNIDRYEIEPKTNYYVVQGSIHYVVDAHQCSGSPVNLLALGQASKNYIFNNYVTVNPVASSTDDRIYAQLEYTRIAVPLPKKQFSEIKEIDIIIKGEF